MRGVHITLRMRLECRIVRQNQKDNTPQELYEVLNEVVVDRGANPYLAKIECWERDTLITKVPALSSLLSFCAPALRCSNYCRACPASILSRRRSGLVVTTCRTCRVDFCHCRSGASGWSDVGNPHGEYSLFGGSRRVHGAPQRAGHPLHPDLPALPLIQVQTLLLSAEDPHIVKPVPQTHASR